MTPRRLSDVRSARSTALVFACAFCALVVSVLVVQRSSAALSVEADTLAVVAAGTLELTDDDAGTALIDVSGLAPGRPIERCIAVTYSGNVVPAAVSFTAEVDGALGSYLTLLVEEGTGGSFDSCSDFVAVGVVSTGRLADLSGVTVPVAVLRESPASISFRVVVQLVDDGNAQGLATRFALTWEAVPG